MVMLAYEVSELASDDAGSRLVSQYAFGIIQTCPHVRGACQTGPERVSNFDGAVSWAMAEQVISRCLDP